MTMYEVSPPPTASVAISGSDKRFPVRRIHCVGRNYAAHTVEMGGDPNRETPFFFMKPNDSVCDTSSVISYPSMTQNFHFEVELVIAVGKGGSNIAVEGATDHVFGYAVGIDMTRRDLQNEAKKGGRPWDWSKGCDMGAPCGPITPATSGEVLESAKIWLSVNGEIRQESNLSNMIWPVADIISFCSQAAQLKPGDLIFTGTPDGVGPVIPGDKLVAGIDGLDTLEIEIA